MEAYTWLIVVAAWSLLTAVGLAGGDPLFVSAPSARESVVRSLVSRGHRLLRRHMARRPFRFITSRRHGSRLPTPASHASHAVAKRATDSGLHAVA